jgi:hypothetical protein
MEAILMFTESLSFSHSFPYLEFEGRLKPIIQVVLSLNGNECTVPMLVDSGAISTALPPEWAGALGVDLEGLPEEIGGGIIHNHRMKRVDNVKAIIVENEIELIIPVYFIEDMHTPGGLLGREAVFDKLRIAFRERNYQYIHMALD